VFARGNRREATYLDDPDRKRYLAMLGRVTTRMDWSLLAFCLMGNHVHMLIETRTPNLGDGMHRLHGGYAQFFNRRHGYVGHLFQGRFDAVGIESDAQLWVTAAYIARNPVEAGLCATAAEWPWSSHSAIVRGRPPAWLDHGRLMAYFAAPGGDGRRRYLDMVDALAKPKGDSPL
jgi:REP element-mobilizing transposase RayT